MVERHKVEKIQAIQVNSSAHEIVRLARGPGSPSTNSKQDGVSSWPALTPIATDFPMLA
jgi:hypothetical protein